ncbi:hypothetical protein KC19_1G256300 [Ceratodon purpureus]|uniref:C2H2-type domain-containing protein n=1 Tax=Ceratodon purpureus TaxID=3225 RepID=A0A8T0J9S2_CERPU|nr:hypothetical protein KC19_1G256300 [Ceratodon purpureus]
MADELSDVATKPWTEGPHFWGMDPKVIAHFSFYAMCNYENCQEYFPFTVGLGEEMRKHYNAKHRLYCKACKKDFNSKGELEIHLSTVHRDGVCFMCQASFDLPAPLAMHVSSLRTIHNILFCFPSISYFQSMLKSAKFAAMNNRLKIIENLKFLNFKFGS